MADSTPITKDGIFMDDVSIGDKIDIIKPIVPIKPIRMPKLAAMRTMAEYSIPTPVTRVEMYLYVIAGGVWALPTPITREEIYLAKICGMDVAIPIPLTRHEMYLYKLAGGEWDVPAPVTRIEKYLYHNCGYEIEVPEPITREEIYWNGGQPVPEVLEGVPPLTFSAKRTGALVDYRIDGNTFQSSTPTPDNPIEPEFVGERTENLFGGTLGELFPLQIPEGTKVFVSQLGIGYYNILYLYDENKTQVDYWSFAWDEAHQRYTRYFTAAANVHYVRFPREGSEPFLAYSSTYVPYEPYGYKIPILSAGQTKTIYLGQVQTTRRIKKLVLTGEEEYRLDVNNVFQIRNIFPNDFYLRDIQYILCNAYNAIPTIVASQIPQIPDLSIATRAATIIAYVHDNRFETVEDFKSYLTAQYTAGTPVTVWYVLRTPETGIVNEPLAKIGDYADSVDFSQAGVEIPVTAGENTLSVGTTIQPSNMMISYK